MRRQKGGSSDPWNDVSNQVSVDPVDDAGIDISHLLQRDLILESVREELVQERESLGFGTCWPARVWGFFGRFFLRHWPFLYEGSRELWFPSLEAPQSYLQRD